MNHVLTAGSKEKEKRQKEVNKKLKSIRKQESMIRKRLVSLTIINRPINIRLFHISNRIFNQQGYVETEVFNVRWLTTAQKIKRLRSKENEFSTTIWKKRNNGHGYAKMTNIEIK